MRSGRYAARTPVAWIIAIAVVSGCATLARGPTEEFVLRTTPSGAQASSSSGWECVTPCTVTINRRGDFVVALQKGGYATKTVTVQSVFAPPSGGLGRRVSVNTGMIGQAADMASGANYQHKPNPLEVRLERNDLD